VSLSKNVQEMGNSESCIDDLVLLLDSFLSYDQWEYMGEICKRIYDRRGIYIRPEGLEKIAKEMTVIKRMWSELGWKYKKFHILRDYIDPMKT